MSVLIHADRLWDLSQPVYHDGPAWAECNPPNLTHTNLTHHYRCQARGSTPRRSH